MSDKSTSLAAAQPQADAGGQAPAKPEATPRRWHSRWQVRIAIYVAVGYALWLTVLFLYQDKMLFPTDMVPPPKAEPDIGDGKRLQVVIDGGYVEAWYFPVADAKTPTPLVVYFHGNAELIDEQWHVVDNYRRMGVAVLLPEYRGYGRSAGKPSQEAIVADTAKFIELTASRREIASDRIIYHGRSVGGAVAAAMAARRPPNALVLESTFTSMAAMAATYGAPGFLARNPFRTDRVLSALRIPVMIAHGTKDRIIPVRHGRKLAKLAHAAEFYEYDCGHNDFPGVKTFYTHWKRIRRFLESTGLLGEAGK